MHAVGVYFTHKFKMVHLQLATSVARLNSPRVVSL